MANTTFSGPVRSENGFQQVTKDGTTGVVSQKQFEVQTVATSGINNIVDTNGFSGTATAAGANNASLDTGATIFGITPNAHGSGIADASINTFVNKVGGTIVTSILIDLHGGFVGSASADRIIGVGTSANAYIAELTKEVNGIPILLEFGCVEVPTGGDPDINVDISATGTTASGAAVASGTQMMNNGDLTLGYYNAVDSAATMAALSKKYIYLVQGAATNAAYTAGKIWIRITGMNVDFNNG
jgi:hypothetical protein|tara:strand:+ start:652 stop:1380 length:729 start_codon:yes stop_codon:yes gene_type:complete